MIASIRGTLTAKNSGQIVVDVQGVGYLVNVSSHLASRLELNSQVSLFTAMIVREDAMTLFGFATSLDQELFDLLRSVTGVGPKSALAILTVLTAGEIATAVARENDAAFRAVSGIGPKTAKLITVTLAGKLSHLVLNESCENETDYSSVTEALVSLGWPEKASASAVAEATENLKVGEGREAVLRLALAKLGSARKSSGNG